MLTLSPSPHIHSGDSVRRNMLNVVIALLPAYLVSLYFFGLGALITSAIAIVSCLVFEYLIQRFILKGTNTLGNLSALVTGMLLAFNLPSNLDWWIVVIGALVAIGIGKMTFGGLGNNPFNPALVGRVFLLIAYPAQMTTWPTPQPMNFGLSSYVDAQTGATTLSSLKAHAVENLDWFNMLIGNTGGSLGEVCAIALLIGFVYLLCTKTITWHIPITIMLTVVVCTGLAWLIAPNQYANPAIHLLSGGLMLGAIFMATDYVTSPMTIRGQVIYAIGIGVITSVIRLWGAYPEGMSFAILLMNAATCLINAYVKPRRFGDKVKTK